MLTTVKLYDWNLRGGSHVQYKGGLYETSRHIIDSGMAAGQFFLGNPQRVVRSVVSESDMKKTSAVLHRHDVKLFSHAPYVYNLCGQKDCLCWGSDKDVNAKTSQVLQSLQYELDVMNSVGGGVVLHPGSASNRREGLETVAKSLDKINFTSSTKPLLLENSAGQGSSLGVNFYELRAMLATLNKDNIGICIDTAHLWGAGEYRIDRKDEIDRMFHDYDRILGLETLQLIHLNDSCVDFGSRKDRHERVGCGKIWHRNTDVLRYFISSLETLGIAFILETVPEDYDAVYTLYKTDL